ncbi:cytochrome oxidase putative small subunit CydP [Rugamonas sp.]|uniref:cytochrome oxidase putative small subunit CydP n=1 Tax=Rugamonas sp. TaxID=1926287 RepID=UPI0025D4B904|nr:cytochrome oxidase putative small subunit CydP [Rugamonas sp.]
MIHRRLHGTTLAAAITAALLLKALLLYGLWTAFFAQPQAVHMHMPAALVAQHLLGSETGARPATAATITPTAPAPTPRARAAAPAPAPEFAPPPASLPSPPPPTPSKGER